MSRIGYINNNIGNKVKKIVIPVNKNSKYSVVLAMAVIPKTNLHFSYDYPNSLYVKQKNKYDSRWQVVGSIRQTETLEEARDYMLEYVNNLYKVAKENIGDK